MEPKSRKQHFLVVPLPTQGHINPCVQLARRLSLTTGSAVTLSTAISGHRRLFPSGTDHIGGVHDGLVDYVPHSDGYESGFNMATGDPAEYVLNTRAYGYKTLSAVIRSLADHGRPVTCIIYGMFQPWVPDLARDLGIRSFLFWIQPATVFTIYYHHFHGYEQVIRATIGDPSAHVNLPGLPQLGERDLPSLLTLPNGDHTIFAVFLDMYREMFHKLDVDAETKILVNTFDELEKLEALSSVHKFKFYEIGPMVPFLTPDNTATVDEKAPYMDWLDSKPEKSVVYVSFGSLSRLEKKQMEEMLWGLKKSGRPYLWVVRKDNRSGEVELNIINEASESEKGKVVEWCEQVRVLSHPAVGCFVTHVGWNSTLESLYCGVPTVCFPQCTDQWTNAKLVEDWGVGVRAELNGEGVLEGKELLGCLETVMADDDGGRGPEMRRKAKAWMDKARTAMGEGGSLDRNLKAFIEDVTGE